MRIIERLGRMSPTYCATPLTTSLYQWLQQRRQELEKTDSFRHQKRQTAFVTRKDRQLSSPEKTDSFRHPNQSWKRQTAFVTRKDRQLSSPEKTDSFRHQKRQTAFVTRKDRQLSSPEKTDSFRHQNQKDWVAALGTPRGKKIRPYSIQICSCPLTIRAMHSGIISRSVFTLYGQGSSC